MPKLIILGSSNSIPDAKHENTHMVLVGQESTILIDCVSNPILRLQQAGVDQNELTDVILTHFHPDHVSGLPLLLMDMWLMGRNRLLNIYGLHYTLDRIEELMGFYGWADWPNFFPVAFYRLSAGEKIPVLKNQEFEIIASQVNHMIPCIGLRMESKTSGKTLAYSCDTEPCAQVICLADNVDVLIHEATGSVHGHSSAMQAGEIANQANAKCLYLIHYPTGENPTDHLVTNARMRFNGPIFLAEDFLTINL
jgi:ribonuclease Z